MKTITIENEVHQTAIVSALEARHDFLNDTGLDDRVLWTAEDVHQLAALPDAEIVKNLTQRRKEVSARIDDLLATCQMLVLLKAESS